MVERVSRSMKVLLHIGLNKCASTYVQQALDEAHRYLRDGGTWYPWQRTGPCQYELSKHYGFGPDDGRIGAASLGDYVAEARVAACDRLILSSEYLSLFNPKGVARTVADAQHCGADLEVVVFRRPLVAWIRALFNQYVKTVEEGPHLASIDAFVDQVLRNRAVDIARRIRQWQDVLPAQSLALYELSQRGPDGAVLGPFGRFANRPVPIPGRGRANASLSADQLYAVGQLRQQPPGPRRNWRIARLLAGGPAPEPAPPGYLQIGAPRQRRLLEEIDAPARALPWQTICAAPMEEAS